MRKGCSVVSFAPFPVGHQKCRAGVTALPREGPAGTGAPGPARAPPHCRRHPLSISQTKRGAASSGGPCRPAGAPGRNTLSRLRELVLGSRSATVAATSGHVADLRGSGLGRSRFRVFHVEEFGDVPRQDGSGYPEHRAPRTPEGGPRPSRRRPDAAAGGAGRRDTLCPGPAGDADVLGRQSE